jgi:hypothetical protein
MENSFNKIILCKKCNDFISSQLKDKDNITKEETDNLNIKNENENICEFCFNSLNNNDYSYLITKIGEKIKEYEYLHLNIQTRFSCLFNIFHFLLMNKLNQIKNIKKENISEIIKSSQIRKLFKEDFSKIFTKQLNIKIESDPGDMIVVMTFNFRQKIYDEMNTIFKEFQDKDNKIEIITPEDDNSKIKYYLDLINSNNKLIEEINQKLTLDCLCQNFFWILELILRLFTYLEIILN